jgi:hypothetical protein
MTAKGDDFDFKGWLAAAQVAGRYWQLDAVATGRWNEDQTEQRDLALFRGQASVAGDGTWLGYYVRITDDGDAEFGIFSGWDRRALPSLTDAPLEAQWADRFYTLSDAAKWLHARGFIFLSEWAGIKGEANTLTARRQAWKRKEAERERKIS